MTIKSSAGHRVKIVFVFLLLASLNPTRSQTQEARNTIVKRPNVIVILADDLGYGDLSCYGHPRFRTPNIDRMAAEGVRLTNFYSTAPNCTPSRAALQTGRYQFRSRLGGVLNPSSKTGIPDEEVTLGEAFKAAGYATSIIGKWHLGHLPQFLPTRHGYDSYFGIPYSNDMVPVNLYENDRVVEDKVQQETLTKRYTERAVEFIRSNRQHPFFLYLPHTMPHKPLAASPKFQGRSRAGLYGDTLMELDWSVGQVLKTLKELGLDKNTLILLSSDNGAWYGGSTGGLRGMKNTTFDGGIRVPLIARFPGVIRAKQVSSELAMMADLYPTVLMAAGITVPQDRILDGKNIMPLLARKGRSPHEAIFTFNRGQVSTVRAGKWKMHTAAPDPNNFEARVYKPEDAYVDPVAPDGVRIIAPIKGQAHGSEFPGVRGGDKASEFSLFDMEADKSEQHNVADTHPEVVERLRGYFQQMKKQMNPD